jgi:uncharacterized membrane protein YeaQ/YmgE (transglycosylase-associated protein family)
MGTLIVICLGMVSGLICNKILNLKSGFGIWQDIFLGATGATVASIIVVYGYFLNIFSKQAILGFNFYNIIVDTTGAIVFICTAWCYKKIIETNFLTKTQTTIKSLKTYFKYLKYRKGFLWLQTTT